MDGANSPTRKWVLTPDAFDRFLLRLDPDRERAGEEYENLRRSLLAFFRHHCASCPEDLADETINRTIKLIGEGAKINHLPTFLLGVARNVRRESQRAPQNKQVEIDDKVLPPTLPEPDREDEAAIEARFACLRECLRALIAEDHFLIWRFHTADAAKRIALRKELALTLKITDNALRIRAHKIKGKLKSCLTHCLGQTTAGNESALLSVDV